MPALDKFARSKINDLHFVAESLKAKTQNSNYHTLRTFPIGKMNNLLEAGLLSRSVISQNTVLGDKMKVTFLPFRGFIELIWASEKCFLSDLFDKLDKFH